MQRKVIDVITEDVRGVFNFDEESLFMLRVDHGTEYLKKRFPDDPEIAERLQAHPQFWSWWMELWGERDKKLLSMVTDFGTWILYTFPIGRAVKLDNGDSYVPTESVRIPLHEAWEFYKRYHSPDRIKFYPNYVLINQCMIEK